MKRETRKVKELATELGVTSRAVIDRCREHGVWVQNSITRLDAPTVRRVRAWFAPQPEGAIPDGAESAGGRTE